jgi:small ligand-binding sensory domain FIST
MLTGKETGLRFSVATSREPDAEAAGRAVARTARAELNARTADLAFLFFSSHYAAQAPELCGAVRRELGPGVLVGCTGEGIIAGSEELETGAAVTLWAAHLPGTRVAPLRLSYTETDEGVAMEGWPEERGADRPTFILLADPFSTPANELLSELADRYPGAAAIGGLAGGGRDEGENRLVLDGEVYEDGVVGVGLSGPVSVRTIVSQGCRPIGDPYVITKAEHNVIYELGGSPALERLQTVFESLPVEQRRMAHQALHLGIVIDEHRDRFERGDFLVRNLIGADRASGSMAIGDHVQEGQTVQFHLRDARAASEDLNLLLAADRARHPVPPLGALLFSCCGRGRGLFGRPHHDITTVRERMNEMPVAGFFAQGEIGPVGGSNFLHGYTASLALFSEPDS